MKARAARSQLLGLILLAIGTFSGCASTPPASSVHNAPGSSVTDPRILGTWFPTSYVIAGTDHKMKGLMIITPQHFMSNTVVETMPGVWNGANANSGPYHIDRSKLVLTQWMQLHYRGDKLVDPKETFLTEGVVEEINYAIEDGKLVFKFPSGNRYISERAPR